MLLNNEISFCLLKQVIEGKIKGEMEVTRRRGRRRKKLLDDLKDGRGYSHLKEEALDRTVWRNRFGGGFGPVVRQNTEWMMIESEPTYRTFFHDWCVFQLKSSSKNSYDPRSEVHTSMILKIQIFWHVTPYRLVNSHRRFEGSKCLPLQGQLI